MPSGKTGGNDSAKMPKREPGAQGLYSSVSISLNSGLMRRPQEMPAAMARGANRSYWLKELNVIWLEQRTISSNVCSS